MAYEKEVERFGFDTVVRDCCGTCGRAQVPVVQFFNGPPGHAQIKNCANCLVDLANIVAFAVVP
jgi:hypothetical protein